MKNEQHVSRIKKALKKLTAEENEQRRIYDLRSQKWKEGAPGTRCLMNISALMNARNYLQKSVYSLQSDFYALDLMAEDIEIDDKIKKLLK